MESDLYTVRVASEAAGLVVRGSAATLQPALPTTAIYEDNGTYIALSDQVRVWYPRVYSILLSLL